MSMTFFRQPSLLRLAQLGLGFGVVLLAACSGSAPPKPAELGPNAALLGVKQAWVANIGAVEFALAPAVVGDTIALASSEGNVVVLNAQTGAAVWQTRLDARVAAGVGSDGRVVALVTSNNEVVALSAGKVLWRQRLPAKVFTAPLVAGERVFVLAADRSVNAFDAQNGRKLWIQERTGDPLLLQQAGVLLPVGDNLLVGWGGRLVALDPNNGSLRWEAAVSSPRGTNEIERLVDLVASASRVGDSVCVRAFQSQVACVNALRGSVSWVKPANGSTGLNGDERTVFGTESDGRIIAWDRNSGERAWVSDRLRYRGLSQPLALSRVLVVGDRTGLVHVLSRQDAAPLNRLNTDGSAITIAPVLVGTRQLVVVTRRGGVYGFVPE